MSKDLYNPSSAGAATGTAPLPSGWTPVFGDSSAPADQARIQNQAVQDIPPAQGMITTSGSSVQRSNNAPVSVKTNTSALEGVETNKDLYNMSESDLKNNMGQLGVNIAKTTERNVVQEIQATMGGTTSFDRDLNKLMYEKNRIRPMMMSTINEYANPYDREKMIAQEEKRIEDKIVEVQAEKQSRLGTIDMALKASLEDKQNDLNAAAKLYEVYKNEVGDRREAEKLAVSMKGMLLDIEKTKQEIAFNDAAMPYKIEQLKTEGNSMSRNPLTGEMEVYDRSGNRIDNQLPESSRSILSQQDGYLPTDGKYRQDKGGGYECGEGANKLTGMTSTPGGNDKSSRTAAYNDTMPVQMGQVFFDGPGFDKSVGHIETVVTVDPATGTFTTKGFNKNNDGKLTSSTYNIKDLQAKGVHVGFYNNTPAAKKIGSTVSGGAVTETENRLREILKNTDYKEADKDAMIKLIRQGKSIEEVATINTGLADEIAFQNVESTRFEQTDFTPEQQTAKYPAVMKSFEDYKKAYGKSMTDADIAFSMIDAADSQGVTRELQRAFLSNGFYPYETRSGGSGLAQIKSEGGLSAIIHALYDDGVAKEEIISLIDSTNPDTHGSGWFWDTKGYDQAEVIIKSLK